MTVNLTVREYAPVLQQTASGVTLRVTETTPTLQVLGGGPTVRPNGVRYLSTYAGTDRTGATDCGTAVQAAITAWAGTYKIVVDGVFKCTSEALDIPSGTWLEAARWGVDGFTFGWQLASSGQYFIGNSTTDGTVNGIKLRGLKIVGAGSGDPWGDNETSGAPASGVKLTSVYSSEVVGCTFANVTGICINYSGRDLRFTDNRFEDCGRDGITGYWRSELGLKNVLVANNTFRRMGDDCVAVWAGAAAVSNGTTATVSTTSGDATVTGSGTSWVAGDVGKRIAIDQAQPGVSHYEGVITAVNSSTSVEVAPTPGRTASSVSCIYGFERPANITITGNVIEQNIEAETYSGNRGINVGGVESVEITGNTIRGTAGQGIRVGQAFHSDYIFSRGVSLDGNTIVDAGQYAGGASTSRRHGIELQRTIACSIKGGSVRNSYGRGIYIRESVAPSVSGVVVERNGTADDDHGVQFWGTGSGVQAIVSPVISDCVIRENRGGGVHFFNVRDGVASNNVVQDNGLSRAAGADQAGFKLEGSIGWTLIGNVLQDTHTGDRTQTNGIRVTNSGGTPYLVLIGNYIAGHQSSNITISNTSTTVVKRGNIIGTVTDADSYDQEASGPISAHGSGSPEGVVTAAVGSIYRRTNGSTGTTLYVKESGTGNTGWAAVGAMSAAAILAALLTVDGAGSGLDADLLDGQSSAYYATATSVSDHLADTADAHDASAISYTGSTNLAADDVEEALDELDSEKLGLSTGGTVTGTLSVSGWSPARPVVGGTTQYSLPGVTCTAPTTLALGADRRHFMPIYVLGSSIVVDQLAFEVTTGVGASTARVGLMAANESWQPTSVLIDSGALSTASNGVVTYTPGSPVTLTPGPYLLVLQPTAAIAVRVIRGSVLNTPIPPAMGTNTLVKYFYKASMTGALDTTAYDVVSSGATPFEYMAVLRISDPSA